MNRCVLIGNLTKDPELRNTASSGIAVCTFALAVSRRMAAANGERAADFIPVVAWRGLAEICAKYLRKGSQAAVCGAIQTRHYDTDDGTRRYVTEVVADEVKFLGRPAGRDDDGAQGTSDTGAGQQRDGKERPAAPTGSGYRGMAEIDDDFPF